MGNSEKNDTLSQYRGGSHARKKKKGHGKGGGKGGNVTQKVEKKQNNQ